MFIGYRCSNTYQVNYRKLLVLGAVWIMLCIGAYNLAVFGQNQESDSQVPLLLNSGRAEVDYADLNVILWFDNEKIPDLVWTEKPTPDWTWMYKELRTENQTISVTLSGNCYLNKSQEHELFKWYTTMVPTIEKAGGRIYLDERIPQVIDVAAYLTQANTDPAQWVLTGNLISAAAYQNNIETSVTAGQDKINIQLLSRGKGNEGQTVLAIPVLLKEF